MLIDTSYIGNTQQKFKKIMDGNFYNFSGVQRLIKYGQ